METSLGDFRRMCPTDLKTIGFESKACFYRSRSFRGKLVERPMGSGRRKSRASLFQLSGRQTRKD